MDEKIAALKLQLARLNEAFVPQYLSLGLAA